MRLHPATWLVAWLALSICAQFMGGMALAALSGVLLLALSNGSLARFAKLARRSRWLLFSLMLIYGWATPGAELAQSLGAVSPSWEGLASGLLQSSRLILFLAALALLLEAFSTEELLGGLYFCLQPARVFGLAPERVAVRLWLTLRYAESGIASSRPTLDPEPDGLQQSLDTIVLVQRQPTKFDALALLAIALALSLCVAW